MSLSQLQSLPELTLTFTGNTEGPARDKDVGSRHFGNIPFNPKSELVAPANRVHAVSFNFKLSARGGNRHTIEGGVDATTGAALETLDGIMKKAGVPVAGQPRLDVTRTSLQGEPTNLEAMYGINITYWAEAGAVAQRTLPLAQAMAARHYLG